jgi:hypothetical protein
MNWMDGFKAALLTYIRKNGHADAEKILYWDEQITSGDLGGCDTCGYGADDPYELNVQFVRADGTRGVYTSTTPFGELISTLAED